MTADGKRVPKYARVAAEVKGQIADGTLRPGQPAPSGAALSRVTGYSTLTCRRALRILIADGVLLPGPSRNARPRVAGSLLGQGERDLTVAARALSRGLASRRRATGLTQPKLARLLAVSVTTIGHAETGRLWQSRDFWAHADAVLGAGGELLRLHDGFGEASAATAAAEAGTPEPPGSPGSPAPGVPDAGEPGEPAGPLVAGPGADQGPAGGTDEAAPAPGEPAAPAPAAPAPAAPAPGGSEDPGAGRAEVPPPGDRAGDGTGAGPAEAPEAPEAEARRAAAAPGAAAAGGRDPACVTIVWSDGAVTTVRPPGAGPRAGGARPSAGLPGEGLPGEGLPG